MNLEPVCVESPRLVPSQPSSHGELKQKAAFGNDGRGDAGRNASCRISESLNPERRFFFRLV
jgi:hypothetical protein